jgi:hypothetical protein
MGGDMKDAGMRIRIEPELKDAFIQTCRDAHTPAAQVLRSFMREYVQQNLKKSNKQVLSGSASRKAAA